MLDVSGLRQPLKPTQTLWVLTQKQAYVQRPCCGGFIVHLCKCLHSYSTLSNNNIRINTELKDSRQEASSVGYSVSRRCSHLTRTLSGAVGPLISFDPDLFYSLAEERSCKGRVSSPAVHVQRVGKHRFFLFSFAD